MTPPFPAIGYLVGIEDVAVLADQRRVLPLLVQHAIADDQHLDLGTHQATERVFRRVRDRLAADTAAVPLASRPWQDFSSSP
jgi:hypothetical protein